MSKYIVIYTGLSAAGANLEVVNASWKRWFQELGAAEMVKKCPGLANARIEVYEAVPFS